MSPNFILLSVAYYDNFHSYILLLIRMSAKKINKQIIVNLCECILQSRINVEKEQIQCFNQFLMNSNKIKCSPSQTSLQLLLNKLIRKQRKQPRQKVNSVQGQYKVLISFILQPENKKYKYCVQTWILTLSEQFDFIEHSDETLLATSLVFQELLFLLTSQPVDAKMKKQYQICYKFHTNSQFDLQQLRRQQIQSNFLHYPIVKTRYYLCSQYKISIKCYSVKSIHQLDHTKNRHLRPLQEVLKKPNKQHKLKSKQSQSMYLNPSKNEREDFVSLEFPQKIQRRLSLFQVYDNNLECTLLSSSQSSFTTSPKGSVKEIRLALPGKEHQIQQEEFVVLEMGSDEIFLYHNKGLFKELSNLQQLRLAD